jgi:hypothetical protein
VSAPVIREGKVSGGVLQHTCQFSLNISHVMILSSSLRFLSTGKPPLGPCTSGQGGPTGHRQGKILHLGSGTCSDFWNRTRGNKSEPISRHFAMALTFHQSATARWISVLQRCRHSTKEKKRHERRRSGVYCREFGIARLKEVVLNIRTGECS